MANGHRAKIQPDQFKKMDQGTKDFHVITTLNAILEELKDARESVIEKESNYARKWVENY